MGTTKKRKKEKSMKNINEYVITIPLKLPSLNEYINACRYNKFKGAKMKKDTQKDIAPYLLSLPKLNHVKIDFEWYEGNKRRDLDNVHFGKKFILDTLVELGKLKDDNRKNVCAFSDSFYYGKEWKVILKIQEVEDVL